MRDTIDFELPFLKMHGAGNDFVILDSRGRSARMTPELARAIGDRHRGVGFDQLAEIRDSEDCDIALDFWNVDGSRAGACGNATRCVADRMMLDLRRDQVSIRTERGVLFAERLDGRIWINMGPPQLAWNEVPLSRDLDVMALPMDDAPVAVGMGNPHAVHFVDDAEEVALEERGAAVEHHAFFPEQTNVEFATITGPDRIRMRVWERGTGVTLACGSGACATAVAAHLKGLTSRRVTLDLDGGKLLVDWRDDGVWLSGPVTLVFEASLSRGFLDSV